MSGTIRKAIATISRFFGERRTRAITLLSKPYPQTQTDAEKELDETLEIIKLLEKSIDSLKSKDSEWSQYIDSIEDDDSRKTEETLYEKTISAKDSYMEQIFAAEELIVKLETRQNRLNKAISAQTPQNPPNQPPSSSHNDPNFVPNSSAGSDRYVTVKPPKLVLPEFDGDPMKWRSFWGIFKANIHDRPGLSNIEKLSYLLPQLKGSARNVVEGLLICDENYDIAVDILMQRFDRGDESLLTMLFGQFKRLQQANQGCSPTRRMYDQCEGIFRQMTQTGENVDSSKTLSLDYLSKFHPSVYRVLEKEFRITGHSPLGDIRNAMRRMLTNWESTTNTLHDLSIIAGNKTMNHNQFPDRDTTNRDMARTSQNNGNRDQRNRNFENRNEPWNRSREPRMFYKSTTTPETSSMAALDRRSFKIVCPFCDGDHRGAFCKVYSTVQARLKRIRERGHCERCTFAHHKDECKFQDSCYVCNEKGHVKSICPKASKFQGPEGKDKFGKKGPNDRTHQFSRQTKPDSSYSTGNSSNTTNMAMYNEPGEETKRALYQTTKVEVVNVETNRKLRLRCVFDNLSGRSYITEQAASSLGLKSEASEKLYVSVFGSNKRIEVPTTIVSIGLTKRDGSITKVDVNTTSTITDSGVLPKSWPTPEKETIEALWKSGALADDPFDENDKIDILIGADYVWDFVLGPSIPSVNDVALIPTSFGLMLAGRLKLSTDESNEHCSMVLLCISNPQFGISNVLASAETFVKCDANMMDVSNTDATKDVSLVSYENPATKTEHKDVDEFWKLDSIGVQECPIEDDDDRALQIFEETVKFEEGRYQVTVPWIPGKKELLPTNYDIARRRLKFLAERFKTDPNLFKEYGKVMKQQVLNGVIEKVPEKVVDTSSSVHYLSHHPVIRTNHATTKTRVVYDASAKSKKSDLSLNECQYKGPTILPDLCQLLIRFRTYPIAISADVEKAFLQVALQPSERDVTRFLWFQDETSPDASEGNLAIYRFRRVLFGMRSSPFLLAATILHHLKVDESPLAKVLIDDVYVDNVISGCESNEDAMKFVDESKAIFKRAGMNLTQYYSNSAELMHKLPPEDKVSSATGKILGLVWNGEKDTLSLGRVIKQPMNEPVTKRAVLHFIASVYDPLGFFQPVLFFAKLFLQQLWILKFEWNSPLPQEKTEEWMQIRQDVEPVLCWTLDRYVGAPTDESSLVIFGDASKNGYTANVYLRNRKGHEWVTNLIFAKSRLAPIVRKSKSKGKTESVSIPRLELLAALIACRLANFCRNALRMPTMKVFVFTDSMCVWHWIQVENVNVLKRFVENRVKEIQACENCEFHYVNTSENPADLSTRGSTGSGLVKNELWWKGPPWVSLDVESWPVNDPVVASTEVDTEVKLEMKAKPPLVVLTAVEDDGSPSPRPFDLDPDVFGSWDSLIRRTSTCLIASKVLIWNHLTNETKAQFSELCERFGKISDGMPPTADDYEVASFLWVKWSQLGAFADVFDDIEAKQKNGLVRQLGIRIDSDGILRIHGRMRHLELPPEAKNPVLLSSKCRVTRLIVRKMHNEVGHSGVPHTLTEVRKLYWIPRGRSFVRQMLRNCLVCRKLKSLQTFILPPMPAWPLERVNRSAVFQFVGLDYFGPVKVKLFEQEEDEEPEVRKMWVLLFSCLTARAIHLEPVFDFSTVEFLNSLIRFVSRRGCPFKIISDNAAQFQLADILKERAWKRIPTDPSVLSYAANHGIRWKFITELAPWQGGHYERLVGVVKSVLKTAIGRRLLKWTDFVTLLCETEAIVNSRPLTYVSSDVECQAKVLRPCDFLTSLDTGVGLSDTGFPVRDLGDTAKIVASIWKSRKKHLDKVWKLWYQEYLAILRARGHSDHRQRRSNVQRSPREGEVVIVKDEDLPRGSWKLATVTKLIPSSDGKVRAAEIRLAFGQVLHRAVNFLVPLEIDPPISESKRSEQERSNSEQSESEQSKTHNDTQVKTTQTENNDIAENEIFANEPNDQTIAVNDDGADNSNIELIPDVDVLSFDDDDFLGFSQSDIEHTSNLLRRFQNSNE